MQTKYDHGPQGHSAIYPNVNIKCHPTSDSEPPQPSKTDDHPDSCIIHRTIYADNENKIIKARLEGLLSTTIITTTSIVISSILESIFIRAVVILTVSPFSRSLVCGSTHAHAAHHITKHHTTE
jgi:hypothetical protein